MNVNFLLVLTSCIVVVLKLLGYITMGWTPILWGVGLVFGFILVTMLFITFTAGFVTRRVTNQTRW